MKSLHTMQEPPPPEAAVYHVALDRGMLIGTLSLQLTAFSHWGRVAAALILQQQRPGLKYALCLHCHTSRPPVTEGSTRPAASSMNTYATKTKPKPAKDDDDDWAPRGTASADAKEDKPKVNRTWASITNKFRLKRITASLRIRT